MSSKYRRKQNKRRKEQAKKETKVEMTFRDEWDAMIFLVDFGVEVEYGHEIYIPHDHLSPDALAAVDFLADMGYKPMHYSARPIGQTTSDYLKEYSKYDKPENKGDPDDDI